MEISDLVQAYFQKNAEQFDRLYRQDTRLHNTMNRWLRGPFYRRFALTLAECGDVSGQRVLDIGCGSGRYAVALAEKGADVLGVDFAGTMVELARRLAEERAVADRCRFLEVDFLEHDFDEIFEISLAIGLFDYIRYPLVYLKKMHLLTGTKAIITFPRPGGWRMVQRRVRYRLRNCPIYFHSQRSMADCFASAGFDRWRFESSWAVGFP